MTTQDLRTADSKTVDHLLRNPQPTRRAKPDGHCVACGAVGYHVAPCDVCGGEVTTDA